MQSNTAFLKNKVWWLCFAIISIIFLVSNKYFNNYAENILGPVAKLLAYSAIYISIWAAGFAGLKRIAVPQNTLWVWHVCYAAMFLLMYILGGIQHVIAPVPDYIREINAQCRAFLFTPFPYLLLSFFKV